MASLSVHCLQRSRWGASRACLVVTVACHGHPIPPVPLSVSRECLCQWGCEKLEYFRGEARGSLVSEKMSRNDMKWNEGNEMKASRWVLCGPRYVWRAASVLLLQKDVTSSSLTFLANRCQNVISAACLWHAQDSARLAGHAGGSQGVHCIVAVCFLQLVDVPEGLKVHK